MKNLESILTKLYHELDDTWIFIPLCVSNSIIAYKLASKDEVYWMNFSAKAQQRNIQSITDIYLFYIDFLPQNAIFQQTFLKQIEHLKEFHTFLEEIFHRQKFFFKNIDQFEKKLSRGLDKIPNPFVLDFSKKVFIMAAQIKFNNSNLLDDKA